jgi:PAS domain S-box-containing protein
VATTAHPHADDRNRLLSAWEGSPFGIAFLSADGHIVDSNEAMQSITGYDADELALMPVASYTHPDDNPESVASFRRLLAGEIDSYRLEMRLIRKDGGVMWVDSFSTAMYDSPGAARTPVSMVQDITSRKVAELALRDQNARLSRVVETQAEIAADDLDLDGVSELVARRALELTAADGAVVCILDGDELVTRAAIGSTAPAALISVPLLHRGRDVGSLSVAKDAGVNEEDCRTLELLAVLLSSAVSVASERDARREQVEALSRFETIFEQAPIGIGLVSHDLQAARDSRLHVLWDRRELAHHTVHTNADDHVAAVRFEMDVGGALFDSGCQQGVDEVDRRRARGQVADVVDDLLLCGRRVVRFTLRRDQLQ